VKSFLLLTNKENDMSTIIRNRKAYHDYEIIEKLEAGVKLLGYEVKSIKEGKGTLQGAYIKILDNTLVLLGFNLPIYSRASTILNYDSTRTRKLLVHKNELETLKIKTERQGYTIIPIKFYTKGNIIKIEIGLAKGKKKEDKKRALIEAQVKRQVDIELKAQRR